MRASRFLVGVGVVLIGAVFFAHACQSTPTGRPGTGTAGTSGDAGMPGGTGTAGTVGSGGAGHGGTGGSAGTGGSVDTGGKGGIGNGGDIGGRGGTGGSAGTGGNPAACGGAAGYVEVGMTPCGPTATCDGDMLVQYRYCDQRACSGASAVWQKAACPSGTTCGGGKCLTHAAPPAKACAVATDCALPPTVCVGTAELLIYSDPSCDDGQCHWKEIAEICNRDINYSVAPLCTNGSCYFPITQTGGPSMPPTVSQDAMQPPPAPAQACTKTADCTQPPLACFRDSVVTYVHGVCRAGACSWDVDLDQCAGLCSAGACASP